MSAAITQAARALEDRLNPWHGEFLLAVRAERGGPSEVVAPARGSSLDAGTVTAALGSVPWSALGSVEGVWEALRPALAPALRELRTDLRAPPSPLRSATLDRVLGDWFATTQRSDTRAERAALQRALDEAGCSLLGGFEAMTPGNMPVRLALCLGGGLAVVVFYAGDGP